MSKGTASRSGRLLVNIGALFLTLGTVTVPTSAAPQAPRMVVHLQMTGAYNVTGILGHPRSELPCSEGPDPGQRGAFWYVADYDPHALSDATVHADFRRDTFRLVIHRFKAGVTHYSSALMVRITAVVHGHGFQGGGASDPLFTVSVVVAPDGRSGHFTAAHLAAMSAPSRVRSYAGRPISAEGSWSCDRLLPR